KISKKALPWRPLVSSAIAARCSSVALSSKTSCIVPLPSWIAPGQEISPPQRTPSSFVSPKWPSRISHTPTPLQLPCVGLALNWHGQPQAQLQLTTSSPEMCQPVEPLLAIATSTLRSIRSDDGNPSPPRGLASTREDVLSQVRRSFS